MAGSGKAKYLAGLQSLVQGFQAMDERRRQRLLDNLERERFEDDKAYRRDLLREKVAESHRLMGERAQDASAKQRAAFSEQIQRGRVTKNLESGNLKRAERIAFNRGIALPEHTVKTFTPPGAESELTPLADERMAKSLGMSLKDYIVWRANVGDNAPSGGGTGSSLLDKALEREGVVKYFEDRAAAKAPDTPRAIESILLQNRGQTGTFPRLAPEDEAKARTSGRMLGERITPGVENMTPLPAQEARADIGWQKQAKGAVMAEIFAIAGRDEDRGAELVNAVKSSPEYEAFLRLEPEEQADALIRLRVEGLRIFGIGE